MKRDDFISQMAGCLSEVFAEAFKTNAERLRDLENQITGWLNAACLGAKEGHKWRPGRYFCSWQCWHCGEYYKTKHENRNRDRLCQLREQYKQPDPWSTYDNATRG